MPQYKLLVCSLLVFALLGCDILNKEKRNQTINFEEPDLITKFLGDSVFINEAKGGEGSGKISYSGSDSSVATIDPITAVVKIVGVGETVITAEKAADKNHSAASTSYLLKVLDNQHSMKAWIGESDTRVILPQSVEGMFLTRSTDWQCDLSNYSVCENAAQDRLSSNRLNDTVATMNRNGWFWLQSDDRTSLPLYVPGGKYPNGKKEAIYQFNGFLWIVGVGDERPIVRNSIWATVDGESWIDLTSKSNFPLRLGLEIVVFNNKLWLIGGRSYEGPFLNDIWSSEDGVTWEQERVSAEFSGREGHRLTVYRDKLWLIGGYDGDLRNDIWMSSDGVNWEQVVEAAEFSPRVGHAQLEFNNQLYVIGGLGEASSWPGFVADVWRSSDGATWELLSEDIGSDGPVTSGTVLDNMVWVSIGRETWSSLDGEIWEQRYTEASGTPYNSGKYLAFKGELLKLGDKLWKANIRDDSFEWKPISRFGFSIGGSYALISFNNKLLLINGVKGGETTKTWSSYDGLDWELKEVELPGRYDPQVVVFNDRLWIVGGSDEVFDGGVWSSLDGLQWELMADSSAISHRIGHEVVVFNDKLWLFGGLRADGVWSSGDGVNWKLEVEGTEFSTRFRPQATVFKDKIWVIGGVEIVDGEYIYQNDVWSSVDGVNWVQEVENSEFSGRQAHNLFVFEDKLWVMGGDNGRIIQDLWSSSDGINWEEETVATNFMSTISDIVTLDSRLWAVANGEIRSSVDGVNWRSGYKGRIFFPPQ